MASGRTIPETRQDPGDQADYMAAGTGLHCHLCRRRWNSGDIPGLVWNGALPGWKE